MLLSELKAKLPAGKITEDALTDPTAGEAIISHAAKLAGLVEEQMRAFDRDSAEYWYLGKLRKQLRAFRWSFPLRLRRVPADGFDRTKPMIAGPLFTSDAHPWPILDGKLREPVAQIDLGEVGRLASTDLGEGLLQLWVGPKWDDHLIRIIPTDALASAAVSPVPECITDDYFGGGPDSPIFSVRAFGSWPSKNSNGIKEAWEIVGTAPKVLSWPTHIKNESDDPDLEQYLRSPDYGIIAQFLALLPDDSPSPSHHFLGNFYPVQYTAEDSPPTLLGLESEDPFLWGDHGNAQVWHEIANGGEVSFGFNWSCY